MASAKQIAARKLFAQRAKAGTFRRPKAKSKPARTKNPAAKKKPVAKRAKKAVNAPSQINRKPPTKRLKERRAANTKRGYFPNPVKSAARVRVESTNGKLIAAFTSPAAAMEYARALADKTNRSYRVIK